MHEINHTCNLIAQEQLWRLRSKRAWIREQLRALRGFPKDSAYDEPWSDAFGAAASQCPFISQIFNTSISS